MNAKNTTSNVPTAGMHIELESKQTGEPASRITVEPESVRSADGEFEFYHRWSLESRKNNGSFANDVLRQLATHSGILLAGSLTILTGRIPAWSQGFAIAFFLIALCCSLFGVLPRQVEVPASMPMLFQRVNERAVRGKIKLIRCAFIWIGLGFVMAIVGWVATCLGWFTG